MVDLGDARNFQKRSLNMPKQLKIRINTCDGRRIFFFFSFSFQQLLPVRQGGEGARSRAGQATPWSLLDSEKQSASRVPWTRPRRRGLGRTGHEARGQEGGCSLASGFFPTVLPEDLVESTSQEDLSLSPGRLPPSLWPVRLTECPIPSCSPPYLTSLEPFYLRAQF